MIATICYVIGWYLWGYAFGLEDDDSIIGLTTKIWTCIAGVIANVAGIIVLLIEIALTNPEISFNLTSAEWASTILTVIAIIGGPFLIGLVFGRIELHVRIFKKLKYHKVGKDENGK